jgi:hypothetical protein
LPSCSSRKRALPGVTYAVTNRLLNRSTVCSGGKVTCQQASVSCLQASWWEPALQQCPAPNTVLPRTCCLCYLATTGRQCPTCAKYIECTVPAPNAAAGHMLLHPSVHARERRARRCSNSTACKLTAKLSSA